MLTETDETTRPNGKRHLHIQDKFLSVTLRSDGLVIQPMTMPSKQQMQLASGPENFLRAACRAQASTSSIRISSPAVCTAVCLAFGPEHDQQTQHSSRLPCNTVCVSCASTSQSTLDSSTSHPAQQLDVFTSCFFLNRITMDAAILHCECQQEVQGLSKVL